MLGALFSTALVSLATVVAQSSAETLRGTARADHLIGTVAPDVLLGLGGRDRLEGRRSADFLVGGAGRDRLLAGPGADRIQAAFDRSPDRVRCGSGRDIVTAERADRVAADCEVVSRELSRDRFRGLGAQEGTEVEPDSFSHGKVVVAAFQVGRFTDGGALAIGFSTSKDRGKTWRSGLLPFVSKAARPSGVAGLVADPSVAFDAKHRFWLVASLTALPATDAVVVSRSRDGVRWRAPFTAVRSDGLDKSWIACDNWSHSPHRGNCYLTYLDDGALGIVMRTSRDGGRTWSDGALVAVDGTTTQSVNGAQPLVRPDGTVVVAFTALAAIPSLGQHQIAVARSLDGGATFASQQRVAFIDDEFFVLGVRAPQFVSGDVDAGGTVYLAWHDCQMSNYCSGPGIVVSRSKDGVHWSTPARVPAARGKPRGFSFLPGLAVAPGTRGGRARLAVAYYTMACNGITPCVIDAFLSRSSDGGRAWKAPERLSPESMRVPWLAATSLGSMLGDYISTSFAGGRPVPVFVLATAPPAAGRFSEAVFATRMGR